MGSGQKLKQYYHNLNIGIRAVSTKRVNENSLPELFAKLAVSDTAGIRAFSFALPVVWQPFAFASDAQPPQLGRPNGLHVQLVMCQALRGYREFELLCPIGFRVFGYVTTRKHH